MLLFMVFVILVFKSGAKLRFFFDSDKKNILPFRLTSVSLQVQNKEKKTDEIRTGR